MKKPKRFNFIGSFSSDRVVLGICILLSLVFWLLIKLSQEFVTTRSVNIEYLLPADRSFTELPPKTLLATVRGSGWDLLSDYLGQNASVIELNLPEKENFTLPASIIKNKVQQEFKQLDVSEINHDYLLFTTAVRSKKTVPIRLKSNLSFAANFQIRDSILMTPDSVTIVGSPFMLDTLTSWPTTLLELSNLKKDVHQTLPIVPPPSEILQLDQSTVQLTIPIEGFTQKDLFIPVQVLNAPDSLKIFPKKIRISCLVGLSKYDSLKSQHFLLEADFKNVHHNSLNNTLAVNMTQIPTYVKQVKLDKQSVEYFLVEFSGE